MKKPIILSGVAGSGKSHIAEAIKMQHHESFVHTFNHCYGLPKPDENASLVVFEEVPSRDFEYMYKRGKTLFPKAQLVITTQEKNVSAVDWNQMFYVINCSPICDSEASTKSDDFEKTKKLIEKLKYDYETCQVYVSTLVSSMEHVGGFDAHNHRTMIRENIDKMEELQERIRSLQVEIGETASF